MLAWRLSNTLTTDFCIDALEEAFASSVARRSSTPIKVASSPTVTSWLLKDRGVAISMDGKGAWRDNVFVERFWRSIKYEEVYLRAYESASEAKHFIGRYIAFYNEDRPHSSLDGRTPDEVYFNQPTEGRHNRRGHHIRRAEFVSKKPAPPLQGGVATHTAPLS